MRSSKSTPSNLPSVAVLLAGGIWGTMWWPLRQASMEAGLSPLATILGVYSMPLLFAVPVLFFRSRSFAQGAIWAVGFSAAACNLLFAWAIVTGKVAPIVLLFYLSPVWASLLERFIFREKITGARWTAIGTAILGLVFLLEIGSGEALEIGQAEIFGLMAGFFWALGLLGSRWLKDSSALDKSVAQFVMVIPVALVLVWFLDTKMFGPFGDFRPLWVILTSIGWYVPAQILSMWAAARLSTAKASMLFMIEAPVAIISASWLAGEHLNSWQIVGAVLILGSCLGDVLLNKKKEAM